MTTPPQAHALVGVRVTPRASLLRSGLLSAITAGIPLFGALYWLALAHGTWGAVVVAQVVYLSFILVGVLRWRAGFTEVTATTITKQAFVKRRVVNRADVASVLIAHTYVGGTESVPQFVALSADNRVLLRMRGMYWSLDDMRAVANAIEVPVIVDPDPMSLAEFYERVPGVAYWYEGRSWLVIAVLFVAFILTVAAIGWIMHALGVPGVFTMAG